MEDGTRKFVSLGDVATSRQFSGLLGKGAGVREKPNFQADSTYVIALANMSNLVIEWGCYNYDPNKTFDEQFFSVGSVSRNCNSNSCNTCIENGSHTAVWAVDCSEPYFELTLITQPDANGDAAGATWGIQGDCDFAGGVVCLS